MHCVCGVLGVLFVFVFVFSRVCDWLVVEFGEGVVIGFLGWRF